MTGHQPSHSVTIERLVEALENSQSLLVAILNEPRPVAEIEAQIKENRTALSPGFFGECENARNDISERDRTP